MKRLGDGHVLVVGDIMRDIVVIPDGPLAHGSDTRARIRSVPGGSGANQAIWLAHFDVPTALLARVGAEDVAILTAEFESGGVTPVLAGDAELPTGQLVTLVDPDGERSFFTDRGANLNLCASDLPDDWAKHTALVVLSGYSFFEPAPREAVLSIFRQARERDIPVAVDPSSVSFLKEVGARQFLSWIAGAAILFANDAEAEFLSGLTDVAEQIAMLSRYAEMIVVKQGALGATIGGAGHDVLHAPTEPVKAVDSTGAGDAFLGAFIAAWRAGNPVAGCMRAGNAAGAIAVQNVGGRPPAVIRPRQA